MDDKSYILEIIDELSLVFWLSIYLVSPVFSILEVVVQEAINKMIYFLTNKVQLVREKIQKGESSTSVKKVKKRVVKKK